MYIVCVVVIYGIYGRDDTSRKWKGGSGGGGGQKLTLTQPPPPPLLSDNDSEAEIRQQRRQLMPVLEGEDTGEMLSSMAVGVSGGGGGGGGVANREGLSSLIVGRGQLYDLPTVRATDCIYTVHSNINAGVHGCLS